ncbi:4Fe-4S binding protein [Thermococcus zilligii]|uniref:4Fe-4S binding protein n=1 Tax=Thermococcus zilligii TaxID=54076 RepID=UPI000A03564A|nr:4Fe-4S binding protein [Thermococcus zilligii]
MKTFEYEKCTGCLTCVNFCPHGVYEVCRGCQRICPSGAISYYGDSSFRAGTIRGRSPAF